MAATRILLVRHGQSTWNIEHRWQGRADAPLSDLGRTQAQAAASGIGQIDLIASSTLIRAKETADLIADKAGIGPVLEVPELVERDVGEWSGKTRAEIKEIAPDWEASGYRPEGWEPDSAFLARVFTGLLKISKQFEGAQVLVVAHSGIIITLEKYHDLERGRISNLGGIWVTVTEDNIEIGDRMELIDSDISTGGGKESAL